MAKKEEIQKLHNDIVDIWVGSIVMRNSYASAPLPKTIAKVVEGIWDEKGVLHLLSDDGCWTPVYMLEIQPISG